MNDEKKSLARFDKELQTLEKLLKSKRQGIEDNKLETVEIVKNMTKVNNPEENVLINDNNDDITMKEITNPSKEAPKNIDSNECI